MLSGVSILTQRRKGAKTQGFLFLCVFALRNIGLYSLKPLVELLRAANLRYLQFLSQIETPEVGSKVLDQFTSSKKENNHSYKGFNFFALEDSTLLRMLLCGEFAISGFTNKLLKGLLPGKNTGQVGRLLPTAFTNACTPQSKQRRKEN